MVHKTLFASASFWMLLQLCCLLVVAKSTQNDQAVLLFKRGKQDQTTSNAESEHSLAGAIPDQHLSFPSQSPGYGSFPQSATPFKDHLKGTYPSHSIKEAGKELQKEGHFPMSYHQHLPSSSNRYALDDTSTEGFLEQVQDLWSVPFPAHDLERGEHRSFHGEKGQGADKKAKEPLNQLTRGQRRKSKEDKEPHKAKRTKKNWDGSREIWKKLLCGNEPLLKEWRDYDKNAVKMFMNRVKSTLIYRRTLEDAIKRRNTNRPSTWFNGVIDHPSTLVEDRRACRDKPTLRDAVTEWAATARDRLAQDRGGYLDYMEKVDGVWRMKPLDERCVTKGPDNYTRKDCRKKDVGGSSGACLGL